MKRFNRTHLGAAATLASAILLASGCSKLDQDTTNVRPSGEYIERAEKYRHQGQYRAAIIEARNAIAATPENLEGRIELAEVLNDLGQARQTLKLFENNDPAEKANPRALAVLVDAFLILGKYRSALDALATGDRTAPQNRYREARAHVGLGMLDEARAQLTTLQSTDVADKANLLLARIELKQGNAAAAESLLGNVLQRDPKNIDALTLKAKKEELAGNLDKAEGLLSQALMALPQTDLIVPQKVEVLQNLTTVLTKQGRVTESLIYSKVLSDANPEGMELQNKLKQGIDAFSKGNLDDAEKLVKDAYDNTHNDYAGMLLGMIKYRQRDYAAASDYLGSHLDPETAPGEALAALARAEISLNQPQKLLELISPEQRRHIKDPEIKALLGVALVQSGDTTGGEATLRDALDSDASNAAIRGTLARHYLVTGQAQKAIDLLKQHPGNADDPTILRVLTSSYLAARNFALALASAQRLVDAQPQQASSHHVLGRTALIAKDFDKSQRALEQALKLQPQYRPAQLDLAQLMLLQQKTAQAESIYNDLIRSNNNDVAAIKGLINARMISGSDLRSIETLVLRATRTDTARAVLAELFLRKGETGDAQRLLDGIEAPDAESYAARIKQFGALVRSSQLLQQGDIDQARQIAFDGLRLNPRNLDLLTMLGKIEIQAKSFTEAEKVIEQIEHQNADAPAIATLRADLATAQGDTAGAATQLRQQWAKSKTDEAALNVYKSLAMAGNDAGASAFLDEWQSALPNSDAPLFLRGMHLQQKGDAKNAATAYAAAIKRNPRNALALNNLALIYLDQGNGEATSLAEQAASLAPTNPEILDTYGWVLFKTGNAEKARIVLQRALALAPDDENIKSHVQAANP